MSTSVKTIKIVTKVEGAALAKLQGSFKRLNQDTKSMSNSMSQMKLAFMGLFAGVGIRSLVQTADTFQLLSDRMKVFTGSSEKAAETMLNLQGLAAYAKTSIASLATSYNRLALATQELGLSQEQILGTTLALQQTFRISGATIAEATAATIQLSQGLSSGQLRGQELRSVMEQNTLFAGMLADELGIARGQLIKFAESGKITSDVVLRTLAKNFDKLNTMASQMGVTFEQSLTIAMDAFKMKLHELNQEFGLSAKFANFAQYVVNNLGQIVTAIVSTGVAWKIYAISFATYSKVATAALNQNATMWAVWKASAILSIRSVQAALISTGWAALFVGVGVLIGDIILKFDVWAQRGKKAVSYYILAFKELVNFLNGTVVQGFKYAFNFISNAIESLSGGNGFSAWISEMKGHLDNIWGDITSLGDRLADWGAYLIKLFGKIGTALLELFGLDKFYLSVVTWLGKSGEYFDKFITYVKESWVGDMLSALSKAGSAVKDWFTEIKNQTDKEAGKPKKIFDTEGTQKDIDDANAKIKELNKTADAFSLSAINAEMEKMKNFAGAVKKGTGAFTLLNYELKAGVINLIEYQSRVDRIKQTELNKKFNDGKISVNEYYASLVAIPGAMDEVTGRTMLAITATNTFNNTISKIGTFSSQASTVMENSFTQMEDGFARLVTEGKFGFQEFTDSIVADLARMATRLLIVLPLVNALKQAMNPSTTAQKVKSVGGTILPASTQYDDNTAVAAKGLAFHGGDVLPFAKGGVVTSPTLFPFSKGTGLMGEAGPEAIMPLSRGKDGKLGVKNEGGNGGNTVVNIVNNSSAQIETQESTSSNGDKQIELMIVDKVNRAIGSGRLDKSMGQAYGVKRRGT